MHLFRLQFSQVLVVLVSKSRFQAPAEVDMDMVQFAANFLEHNHDKVSLRI